VEFVPRSWHDSTEPCQLAEQFDCLSKQVTTFQYTLPMLCFLCITVYPCTVIQRSNVALPHQNVDLFEKMGGPGSGRWKDRGRKPAADRDLRLRRDRLVLRGEKAVTSTTTGGDAGAGLGSAGGARAFLRYTFQAATPLLEQCNVLVVSHGHIQEREAVRSVTIAAAVARRTPRRDVRQVNSSPNEGLAKFNITGGG
jgi:hypothetical protein